MSDVQVARLAKLICPDRHRWWAGAMGRLEVGSPCPNCDKPLVADPPPLPHDAEQLLADGGVVDPVGGE